MKKEAVHSALSKASQETSRFLSAHLRSEAHASGWPTHIVRSMTVAHDSDGFHTHVHDGHYEAAMDLEYGTPGTQPTAAVRRFANRTSDAEHFLINRMVKHLEGDL